MVKILISLFFFTFLIGSCFIFYKVVAKDRPHLESVTVDWDSLNNFEERLASGKVNFEQRCNKCHGKSGYVSSLSLRLNDPVWINGDGSLDFIYSVVGNGLQDKGMYGWKHKLINEDLINLSLYVKSLSAN